MILIVVAVHAVSADGVEIGESGQESAHLAKVAVLAKVGRIALGTRTTVPSSTSRRSIMPIFSNSAAAKSTKRLVIHRPKVIAFTAEIFQSQP